MNPSAVVWGVAFSIIGLAGLGGAVELGRSSVVVASVLLSALAILASQGRLGSKSTATIILLVAAAVTLGQRFNLFDPLIAVCCICGGFFLIVLDRAKLMATPWIRIVLAFMLFLGLALSFPYLFCYAFPNRCTPGF